MNDEIKEIQDYLWENGISASETAIIHAATKIAMRWGGKEVFVTELGLCGRRALSLRALVKSEGETK